MLGLFWQAFRSWKTALPVAVLAAAGLAIGIGSAVGIFSVVEAVLLKPLPYANADRYLMVRGEWRKNPGSWTIFSYGDFRDYVARNQTIATLGCYQNNAFNVTFHNQASHVFGDADFAGAPSHAWESSRCKVSGLERKIRMSLLISERLWRRFGSIRASLAMRSRLMDDPYTVVGVMPGWFRFPDDNQMARAKCGCR